MKGYYLCSYGGKLGIPSDFYQLPWNFLYLKEWIWRTYALQKAFFYFHKSFNIQMDRRDMEILPSVYTWPTCQGLKILTIDGMSQGAYESLDTTP